jgi:adenosylcobinamide-GDP ribazoletransferase
MLIFTDWKILLILSPMALSHLWLTRYFKNWIGGYTGDCLGTCQRAGEIVCYLSITALWG